MLIAEAAAWRPRREPWILKQKLSLGAEEAEAGVRLPEALSPMGLGLLSPVSIQKPGS